MKSVRAVAEADPSDLVPVLLLVRHSLDDTAFRC